ncbi:unnamed protein product [Pylaiella littoralis]
MSGKRTLSLSAYKKNKEALAVAPAKREKRLGFGESVSTREARAQELQRETQVIGRLDDLLKRCGRDPAGSARAISDWLCAEGVEGYAKKGLSRILCHVKVWSRTLRSEGVTPKKNDVDTAEANARAAFGACVTTINAVDSLSYRFAEKSNPPDGESELVKAAGEVLVGMTEAMLSAGAKPRARGLHPTEHAQLSKMVESWQKRGALPSPSLEGIGKRLSALKPSGDADAADDNGSSSSNSTTSRSSAARARNKNKRAAWLRTPAAAVASPSADGSPSASAGGGRLSPMRPSSSEVGTGSGRSAVAPPQTEAERNASVEVALKELLARNVGAGGWWAEAFQGSGPFPQGPEGCWSLQFQRANEDPGHRQKQVRGLLGVNEDHHRGVFAGGGVDLGSVKPGAAAADAMDSDGAPSTPSTVPSEASPSPERVSPVPAVKTEADTSLEVEPAIETGENGTAEVVQDEKAPRDGKGSDSKGGKRKASPPKKRVLSKREQEEEDRRRRKEEARRAGKEKGKVKALERERLKKEREMQRQQIIADARKKKAEDEAAKKEKEAGELARRNKAEEPQEEEQQQQQQKQDTGTARERDRSRKRDQPAGKSANQPKGDAAEESRRDREQRDSNKSREGQDRARDRERKERAGGADARVPVKDAERAGGGGGGGGGGNGSGSSRREKDESRRHDTPGEGRGRSGKEDRGKGKETDRASSRRDKDESRRQHDLGESSRDALRGGSRVHTDQHEQQQQQQQQRIEDKMKDDWRKQGSSLQMAREKDFAAEGARRTLDAREREASDKGERKRRRSDVGESEGTSNRQGGDNRYIDEYAEGDGNGSHRPSKKKSKKDKRDRKEKRGDRHSDALRPLRDGSEDSCRGRKRSRDFDAGPPPEGYAAAALQMDPLRRSLESHRAHLEPELGRNGSNERRDGPRQTSGRSRVDSELSPRRGDRRDGSEKRARRRSSSRGGAGDASSVQSRTGASRERHARGGGARESNAGVSSSSGGGLPGMDGYASAASPPAGLELGGLGKPSSGRGDHDRQGLGSLKMVDVYGPAIGRGDSPEGNSRKRRGESGKETGGRPRLATADAYGPGVLDATREGSRAERDRSERDRSERERSERDRSERDRSERDRSERDRSERGYAAAADRSERDRSERGFAAAADKSGRESSGRRGDTGSRQPSSSNVRASRRSPERGTQPTTARDGSYRRRAGSAGRDDSRGRVPNARDGRHLKNGGGGGGSALGSHTSMGMGAVGMGMGVSMIGGTRVLVPVAKMMEVAAAAAASSRGGGDRQSGRLDDRSRHSIGSRWGGGDEVEDRWAGDSHSEDDRDHHQYRGGGGRSEDLHHRRRRDSFGSGSRRSRTDSRDAARTLGQVSPPQEEEPEEGELVIEPSTAALPTGSPPLSPPRRKSRWGDVAEVAPWPVREDTGGYNNSRRDGRPARERGHGSVGDESATGRRDDGDEKLKGTTKETLTGRSTKSRERSSRERTSSPSRAERSKSSNGSAEMETGALEAVKEDGKSERSERNGSEKSSPRPEREPSEGTQTRGEEGSRECRGSGDPAGAAAAASPERSSPRESSPTTARENEPVASGTTEEGADQNSAAAVPGNDVPNTGGRHNSAGGLERAAAEATTTVRGSSTTEAGEGGASTSASAAAAAAAVTAVRGSKDAAAGTPSGKSGIRSNDDRASGDGKERTPQPDTAEDERPSALPPPSTSGSPHESDSNRSGGAADAGGGRSRRRSSGSGDLTPFIRKNGRRRPGQQPASTPATTPAADDAITAVTAAGPSAPESSSQADMTPSDGRATEDPPASATKSQRASVFSRLGAPPSETKKDAAKATTGSPQERSSSGPAPDSAPQQSRGIATTWGSGSSADRASSKGTAGDGDGDGDGDGNGNGNGVGNAGATSTTADASDVTSARRMRGGAKDEARPVGGGAGRLMNAALSSSRDSGRGSERKGGASGRGARGSGRRQRE